MTHMAIKSQNRGNNRKHELPRMAHGYHVPRQNDRIKSSFTEVLCAEEI